MAAATRRTFSKVKSSAIMPRQPSVPNLIGSIHIPQVNKSVASVSSEQLGQLLVAEVFYDLAHVLRMLARGYQNGVFRLDYNHIAHAYGSDEFFGRVHIIAFGIQDEVVNRFD